ncbi:hypothetical protein BV898_01355 [Hypsibius exemplaris]|uniref:MARVEL domain-containing protein n=1 Tax=Hypsibius exemplaris TaxID=2072580 RepID=A0A1W0XBG5_HYPEX|nr:hypothetical protein BV898_01355 [Hypsibius exemplaris]
MDPGYATYGSTDPPGPSISAYGAAQQYSSGSPVPSGQYPTSTTVKSTRIVDVRPYFDPRYFVTPSGILKIIELVCTFIAFVISVATWSSRMFYYPKSIVPIYYPYAYGSAVWTDIVTSLCFLTTLTLLILFLFHIVEKYQDAPWHLIELLFCLAAGCCLLIAGAVMIPAYTDPARGAVVFFCWAAMIAYFVEAFFKFRAWRADESPQGI